MQQIRRSIFETNSSSVHAIVVRRQDFADNMGPMSENLIVDFDLGNFGWEFDELSGDDQKASYLWTLAYDYAGRDLDKLRAVEGKLRTMLQDIKPQECLRFAYPSQEENKQEFPAYTVARSDSQAARDFYDKALSDKDFLIRFLFNEDSYILTGNDDVEIMPQPDQLIRPEDKDKSDIFLLKEEWHA